MSVTENRLGSRGPLESAEKAAPEGHTYSKYKKVGTVDERDYVEVEAHHRQTQFISRRGQTIIQAE